MTVNQRMFLNLERFLLALKKMDFKFISGCLISILFDLIFVLVS